MTEGLQRTEDDGALTLEQFDDMCLLIRDRTDKSMTTGSRVVLARGINGADHRQELSRKKAGDALFQQNGQTLEQTNLITD